MLKLSSDDRKVIELLLTPSWLSGMLAIVLALVVSIGAIVIFVIHNDGLTQDLLNWQQSTQTPQTLTTPDQIVASEKPTFQTTWPLIVLWSLTGLLVYSIAASIIRSLSKAEEVRESLDYVNAQPKALLTTTAEHIVLRIIGSVMLVGFVMIFWKLIIPYSITAAHAAAADLLSITGVVYTLLSFSLVAIGAHVITIALRVALGTVRAFPNS